jgi:hypothetical protein
LSMVASFYCGSFQSLMAMEVWWTKGWWRLAREFADGDQRRRNPAYKGLRDPNVIFVFLGTFV